MIKVKEGNVRLKGNFTCLMSDLTCIVKALMEKDVLDKDDILKCIDIACMSDEEIDKETEKIKKSVEDKLKILFGENVELNF